VFPSGHTYIHAYAPGSAASIAQTCPYTYILTSPGKVSYLLCGAALVSRRSHIHTCMHTCIRSRFHCKHRPDMPLHIHIHTYTHTLQVPVRVSPKDVPSHTHIHTHTLTCIYTYIHTLEVPAQVSPQDVPSQAHILHIYTYAPGSSTSIAQRRPFTAL
jgi:hypothetical protein